MLLVRSDGYLTPNEEASLAQPLFVLMYPVSREGGYGRAWHFEHAVPTHLGLVAGLGAVLAVAMDATWWSWAASTPVSRF